MFVGVFLAIRSGQLACANHIHALCALDWCRCGCGVISISLSLSLSLLHFSYCTREAFDSTCRSRTTPA
uniref:Secreted protein n=1 Tax=Plectus sambesii TaxID=2011161 RepID=A0A914WIB8_9BILA